jgi:hypothetical protein
MLPSRGKAVAIFRSLSTGQYIAFDHVPESQAPPRMALATHAG